MRREDGWRLKRRSRQPKTGLQATHQPIDERSFGTGEAEHKMQPIIRSVDNKVFAEERAFLPDAGTRQGNHDRPAAEPTFGNKNQSAGLGSGSDESAKTVGPVSRQCP